VFQAGSTKSFIPPAQVYPKIKCIASTRYLKFDWRLQCIHRGLLIVDAIRWSHFDKAADIQCGMRENSAFERKMNKIGIDPDLATWLTTNKERKISVFRDSALVVRLSQGTVFR